jgi:membrane protein
MWTRLASGYRRVIWERHGGFPDNLLLKPLRIVLLTAEGFGANRLGVHASGLAFFLLLSLVPLLAFLFLIFKLFQLPAMLRPFLLEMVTGGNMLLIERITEYIENTQSTTLGSVGVLTLLLIGFLLLQRVKATLNQIWHVEKWPGYGSRFIEYVAVLTVTPILLVAAFSVSTYLESRRVGEVFPGWETLDSFPMNLAGLSGFAIVLLLVMYAYWFLPDTEVEWKAALVGTVVGGTGLKIAQSFYIRTMLEMSNYNLMYGALAFLPLLMIWFFLGWLIFLFGAQMCCVTQNYRLVLGQRRLNRGEGETAPYVTLLVLIGLLNAFQRTGAPAEARGLRRETGLPGGAVEEALHRLAEAGLITRVQGQSRSYVPRETPERWSTGTVLRRLGVLPEFSEPPLVVGAAEREVLREAFSKANRAMAKPLERLPILELADRVRDAKAGEGAKK